MAVSHAEAPFSLACSNALCPAPDDLGFSNSASLVISLRFLMRSAFPFSPRRSSASGYLTPSIFGNYWRLNFRVSDRDTEFRIRP